MVGFTASCAGRQACNVWSCNQGTRPEFPRLGKRSGESVI